MKKILTLVFVSVLGGIISLSAYTLFLEKEQNITIENSQELPSFLNANYNVKTSNMLNANVTDFTLAAENTIHSVVHVKNTATVSGGQTLQDLIYGRKGRPKTQVGTGSGVIISPDGYIITNNHVIAGSKTISITLNDNRVYDAVVIGTDEKTDIALLKIEAESELPAIEFGDSDTAKVGEWVLAVGNPFNLTSTVTAGIISAKARDLSGRNSQSFIQTDAAVNPGNSGGALVNSTGQLIGINTAISSQTGSYIGYSFAVPSNIAKKVIQDIIEYGDVQEGILGVSILNRNSREALEKGINEIEGVYVSGVEEKSGAKKAGIKNGDIIIKLDNIEVSKFSDLSGYLKTKRPNDVVNVEVLRDNQIKSIPVTLSKSDIISVDFIDMELRNLPQKFKTATDINEGVVVQTNKNKYLYTKLGIRPGYIITGINNISIKTLEDISAFVAKYGSNAQDEIFKLEYMNTNLERKEVIFE
ncbi:MAG: Do/DeqQ family serine protease [Psychroserpens sp.]|jgi:Do/DeqQ family serine protease|uniref:S1C family serine protease n=1 Tax=Psychroserpens sp. TaxID=2020870 RepID=UPI0039E24615